MIYNLSDQDPPPLIYFVLYFFGVFFILDYDSMCYEMDFSPEKSFSSNYKNSQLLQAYKEPGGQGVGLQGFRGSRGRLCIPPPPFLTDSCIFFANTHNAIAKIREQYLSDLGTIHSHSHCLCPTSIRPHVTWVACHVSISGGEGGPSTKTHHPPKASQEFL